MASSIGKVRSAASDLVDALRGDSNRVAVVSFANSAKVEVPMTDVGTGGSREDVKDAIEDLGIGGLFGLGGGGTNWQSGLRVAADMSPDLVVMISDGEANTYQEPAVPGLESTPEYAANRPLGAAVRVADELRDKGVRVVAIGVGAVNTANLAAISGPAAADDYFTTDTGGLLRQLYEIASRACDIPVAALPQPLGDTFPLREVLIGSLGGLLLLVIIGMLLSRRRHGTTAREPRAPRRSSRKIPVPELVPLPPIVPPVRTEPNSTEVGRGDRGLEHDEDDEDLPDTEVRWGATHEPADRSARAEQAADQQAADQQPSWGGDPGAGSDRLTAGADLDDAAEEVRWSSRPARRYSTEHLFGDEPPGR